MKKLIVIIGLALVSYSAFAATAVTEEREISDFTAVSVSHGINLYLTQSNTLALKVEADEHVIKHLVTKVKGDRLDIYIDGKVKNIEVLNVYLSYKQIEQLTGRSGADIYTENTMESDEIDVDISSGCDLQLELKGVTASFDLNSGADAVVAFEGKKLNVDASSGSSMKIKADELDKAEFALSSGASVHADGSAVEVDVETNSGSSFSGYGLVGINVTAEAYSASSIRVTAVGNLNARAYEVASVYYKGKVDNCNIDENSLGTVSKK